MALMLVCTIREHGVCSARVNRSVRQQVGQIRNKFEITLYFGYSMLFRNSFDFPYQ